MIASMPIPTETTGAEEPVVPDVAAGDDTALTPTESLIAGFWRELLDVDVLTPASDFVELGGNSLTATMLAHRLERALAVRPTMTEILSSTLGELARRCEAARKSSAQEG